MTLAVGFDLDMTLVDSRAGIVATMRAALAEAGREVTDADVWPHIGVPLEDTLAALAPGADVESLAARYRELYPVLGVPPVTLLPGAREALEAVRRAGGRSVVVSAKIQPAVEAVLDHVGLTGTADAPVTEVVGGLFAEAKGAALAEHGVTVYVGDHPGDVRAARAAGAVAVAVATGPSPAQALAEAGADVVLAGLDELPAWLDEHLLTARLADLDAALRRLGRVVVAFSGGADSAFLLAAAVRALGAEHVTAATAVSHSLAAGELSGAAAVARDLGVEHLTPDTDEMAREGYRANAGDRCYFCKAELLDVVGPLAAARDAVVLTGTNADDAVAGFRPGIRAAHERGAVAPLRDAGLTKAQIREASRRWGLVTADKPAAACLSSRVAYGVQITPARLARVDRAEAAVRDTLTAAGVPVSDLRVRDLGDAGARIELGGAAHEAATTDGDLAAALRDVVLGSGFEAAEVDGRGFRSGSMNELLTQPDRYR